ncbi:MAG: Uncharacterized protein YjgR, partial [uncultured Microvirga sp.]
AGGRQDPDRQERAKAGISRTEAGQPSRAHHRGDRHGQDRDPAGAGRRLFQRRRAGLRGRHQGRSLGDRGARRGQGRLCPARSRDRGRVRAGPLSGGVLGPVWRTGPPDPRHDHRAWAPAPRPPARAQRHPGGHPQHRLPGRRRSELAGDRPQGFAGAPHPCGRERKGDRSPIRQRRKKLDRRHPAPDPAAREPGRSRLFRRAGAEYRGLHAPRPRRARRGQHPGRRQAHGEPPALRLLPAVDAVGAVRGTAGGGRPRQAQTGVLLRRGASPLQRRPKTAARCGRAGGAADPLEGGRRVFRDPEPARRARGGSGATRQPGAARLARLYPARSEGGAGRGGNLSAEPRLLDRKGHHRTRRRRGAGLDAATRRRALDGRAHAGRPARRQGRAAVRGRAQDHPGREFFARQIRPAGRFRERLRDAGQAQADGRGAGAGGRRLGRAFGLSRVDSRGRGGGGAGRTRRAAPAKVPDRAGDHQRRHLHGPLGRHPDRPGDPAQHLGRGDAGKAV